MNLKLCIYIVLATLATIFSSCSIAQAIKLKDCTYTYSHISDVRFLNMTQKELVSIGGVVRTTQALAGKTDKVPLSFTIHMQVHNPNKGTASMDRLFYTVSLDSIQIAEGNSSDNFTVAGGFTVDLPLRLHLDLKTLLQKESSASVKNVLMNFLGMSDTPSLVTLNLRPVIRIAGSSLGIPKGIPVSFYYGAKSQDEVASVEGQNTATQNKRK